MGWISPNILGYQLNMGGGTKSHPLDVWWSVKFQKALEMNGIKISHDKRDSIPISRQYNIELLDNNKWSPFKEIHVGNDREILVDFCALKKINGIRILVKGSDLPESKDKTLEGYVKLSEVYLISKDNLPIPIRKVNQDSER